MKIYLASRFDAQKRLREVRKRIHDGSDHLVVSRWIDASPDRPLFEDKEAWAVYSKRCSQIDLLDLNSADHAIFDMSIDLSGGKGGVYAEMGYCLAKYAILSSPNISIVGRRTNVFCYDDTIAHYEDWEALYKYWGIK